MKYIIVVFPDGKAEKRPFDESGDTLKPLQEAVGGWIERLGGDCPDKLIDYDCYVNEEGLIYNLPMNPIATDLYGWYSRICGNMVIVGRRENEYGEICSAGITEEECEIILEYIGGIRKRLFG